MNFRSIFQSFLSGCFLNAIRPGPFFFVCCISLNWQRAMIHRSIIALSVSGCSPKICFRNNCSCGGCPVGLLVCGSLARYRISRYPPRGLSRMFPGYVAEVRFRIFMRRAVPKRSRVKRSSSSMSVDCFDGVRFPDPDAGELLAFGVASGPPGR